MAVPVVELRITINGEDVFAFLADDRGVGPSEANKPLR